MPAIKTPKKPHVAENIALEFFRFGGRPDVMATRAFKAVKMKPEDKIKIHRDLFHFLRLMPVALQEQGIDIYTEKPDWRMVKKYLEIWPFYEKAKELATQPVNPETAVHDFGLPPAFQSEWWNQLPDKSDFFLKRSVSDRPVFLRKVFDRLADPIGTSNVKGVPGALQWTERVRDFGVEWFQAGGYEIQDLSGQLASLIINPKPGMSVLDACAGAGGKTITMAGLMQNKGRVTGLSIDSYDAEAARQRIRRHGITNARIVEKETELDPAGYDIVWVDAPCSGSGTIRRNPDLLYRMAPDSLAKFPPLQVSMINDYSAFLKPGGCLFYSTCSVFYAENEGVTEQVLASGTGLIPFSDDSGLKYFNLNQSKSTAYRFGNDLNPDSDGFYLTAFKKGQ